MRYPPIVSVKSLIGRAISPEMHDYILNHIVNRIPHVGLRMQAYDALGVKLADRRGGMIMLGAEIHAPRLLRIGRNPAIGPCILDARGEITIGDNVNISGGAYLQTATHLVDSREFAADLAPIVIRDRAWVAQRALILGGVTIHEGAVVAAGAVATRDVPAYTVVAGVPARPVRERPDDLDYTLAYRESFI